jgi:RNA polymerase sigma-70 factor (ECF subfamily)
MNAERNIPDMLPTRHSLLSRLRIGTIRKVWRDFFQIYWRLIYEVACKAGLSDADAQEVVQETVISVAKRDAWLSLRSKRGRFKGWLLQITRHRIADRMRRRMKESGASHGSAVETLSIEQIDSVPELSSGFNEIWEAEWERHLYDAAVANVKKHVNPEHYQLFDLYAVQQWPVKRITATLGVSAGQVYLARHRVFD